MATYKKFTKENIINLIFAMPLLSKNMICCNITEDFDLDLDHQFIISE